RRGAGRPRKSGSSSRKLESNSQTLTVAFVEPCMRPVSEDLGRVRELVAGTEQGVDSLCDIDDQSSVLPSPTVKEPQQGPTVPGQAAPVGMRLLNLNIRHGGKKRHVEIAEAIGKNKPDVVVLTEYRPLAAPRLDRLLAAQGFAYRAAAAPP